MHQLRKIYSILSHRERRHVLKLLLLMIVGMIMETLGIGLAIPAIALFMQDDLGVAYPQLIPWLERLGNPSHFQLVVGGMIALVLIYIIKAFFLGYLVWKQNQFNRDVTVSLSQRLFTLYLRQPYCFHLRRNSSELIRNTIHEVSIFINSGLNATTILLTEALTLAGIACLLLFMEPVGTLIVVVSVGTSVFLFQRSTRSRLVRWGARRQENDGMRLQQLQQGLGGVKDVKLLGRENDFLERYLHHHQQSASANLYLGTLQSFPRLWLELMAVTGLALLVIVMMAQGKTSAAIMPILGLFAAAAFRLLPSMGKVLSAVQSARFCSSVVEMISRELQLEIPSPPIATEPLPLRKHIELQEIRFTYDSAVTPALNDLSLTITCGETVGFIGPSGAGKSSLVDVILGLLPLDSGTIRIDGIDIQCNLRGWQDQIGYVPQSIFLTDDTLRRNIAFGLPEESIDDSAVRRAMKAAQLEDFIASLPEGLETVVGERGVRLSGGQRQRIGIARALYHDPAVLVLDEATSALDTATETEVMKAITALHGSKTILIVAHRLSTVEHCDRIYRMELGRIAEQGEPGKIIPKPEPKFESIVGSAG